MEQLAQSQYSEKECSKLLSYLCERKYSWHREAIVSRYSSYLVFFFGLQLIAGLAHSFFVLLDYLDLFLQTLSHKSGAPFPPPMCCSIMGKHLVIHDYCIRVSIAVYSFRMIML